MCKFRCTLRITPFTRPVNESGENSNKDVHTEKKEFSVQSQSKPSSPKSQSSKLT